MTHTALMPLSGQADAVIANTVEAFDFLSADYATLHARSNATAFQAPVWMDAFYRTLAPGRDATAVIITLTGGDGSLLGVLPMTLRTMSGIRVLEAADLGVSDYCAPVIDPTVSLLPDVTAALPAHDVARVNNIRPEHIDLWQALLGAKPQAAGFSTHETHLPSSIETFRSETLAAGTAKYLKRRRNKFLKLDGARLDVARDPNAAAATLDALAKLRAGRFDGDMIALPVVHDFYRALAQKGAGTGFCRLMTLTSNETGPMVHLLTVTDRGRMLYLLIGADYDRHGAYSPGMVAYDLAIEHWIGDGGHIFDFTIGDEAFKADFAATAHPMSRIELARTARGQLALAARQLRDALRKRGQSLVKAAGSGRRGEKTRKAEH